ncbi:MAG TPA: aminoacyl-histidine dipeptidase [Phycisphaerae bacterium]|nr:aminoacyl-histidine dipeptidase [Phycisphaerae bacterium]
MNDQTSSTSIEQLEPANVWRLFAGFCTVPHGSKKEERIRAHVRGLAEKQGFPVREDATGNLVIEVPATPGHENAPTVVLQGHLDMVCEKNTGTPHDFDRDPIRCIIDKDPNGEMIVRADGTTLGADNGIGVALGFAAATSPDVVHGPLELLCTIDEEAGMTGAKALAPDFFKGKRMLNLDSEEDDALYIGCAGGCDVTATWEFKTTPPPADVEAGRITVLGCRGGHSGCDIHLNRASAIKLLVRVLRTAEGRIRLAGFTGGSKRNVIPREASAVIVGSARTLRALGKVAAEVQAEAVREAKEDKCTIKVEKVAPSEAAAVISPTETTRFLTTLNALPHGVLAVVPEIAGLIQTSNSTSTVESKTADGKLRITVGCLARSSSMPQLDAAVKQIMAIGKLGGAAVESGNGYPGWQPDVKSPVLATCRELYEKLFGKPPIVAAIHAGLECGLIGERMGGMDMISFGPHIVSPHSPDEHIYVASVQKIWTYLKAVLAELAK